MKFMKAQNNFVPSSDSMHRPDSFRSKRVWDSDIFRYGLAGGILGAFAFSLIGFLLVNGSIEPGSRLSQGGSFTVITLASAGVLVCALIGSLYALFHRS